MIHTDVMNAGDTFLVGAGSLSDGRNLYNLMEYTGGRNLALGSYVEIEGVSPKIVLRGVLELYVNTSGQDIPERIYDVVDRG